MMKKILSKILWIIKKAIPLFFVLVAVYFLLFRIFGLHYIQQDSMQPNITGFAISNRLAYREKDPRRGDIIVFTTEHKTMVKRVIGLPGDTVTIWGGEIFINGKILNEPYLDDKVITDGDKTYTVPSGMYFVLGDNRDGSYDSRYFTDPFIDRGNIEGRIFYCLRSIKEFPGTPINQYDYNE